MRYHLIYVLPINTYEWLRCPLSTVLPNLARISIVPLAPTRLVSYSLPLSFKYQRHFSTKCSLISFVELSITRNFFTPKSHTFSYFIPVLCLFSTDLSPLHARPPEPLIPSLCINYRAEVTKPEITYALMVTLIDER